MDGYQSLNHGTPGTSWNGTTATSPVSASKRILSAGATSSSHRIPGRSLAPARSTIPAGAVASRWKVRRGQFELEVEVPAGVAVTAILPSGRTEPLQPGTHTLSEPFTQPDSP